MFPDSASYYEKYSPSSVTVSAPSQGVIVASFGGHFSHLSLLLTQWFEARFRIGDVAAFDDVWGSFYIDQDNVSQWRPISYTQMYQLPESMEEYTDTEVHLETKTFMNVHVRGAGTMAVAFPPPAFVSSFKADKKVDRSNRAVHVLNFEHTIEFNTDKALLTVAANGQITAAESGGILYFETLLQYSVNLIHSSRFVGLKLWSTYFVNGGSTGTKLIPMNLYQLFEVGTGEHKVRLQGYGEIFELHYATSQVAVIPLSGLMHPVVTTATAEWETELSSSNTTTTLVSAEVFAESDTNVLLMALTFGVKGQCSAFIQFTIDGKRIYPSAHSSEHQLGAWYESRSSDSPQPPLQSPTPGSMLSFANVTYGNHRVELVAFNQELACSPTIRGATLQVGVVPGAY